jgi:RNA polymerase sigma-70 factor, ECF subfamily
MSDSELEFQNVHDTFRPKILRYLTRMVGQQEAEDVTQEVFAKIAQALNNFRGESQLSTWVYRIATNAALDRLRTPTFQQMTQRKLLDHSGEPDVEDKDAWTGEKTPSSEQQLIQKEMNNCIRNFIENLPENYRTVLVLSELEELKNDDIGQILGLTLETVKVRLHRARAKLKKELETHCSFYHNERDQLACDLKTAFEGFRRAD